MIYNEDVMWNKTDAQIHESTRSVKGRQLKMVLTYLPLGIKVEGTGNNRQELRERLEKKLRSMFLTESNED